MAVTSADTLSLGIIEEITAGVTPATPAFNLVRASGETLTFEPNVSENTELGGSGRSQRAGTVVGFTISGDITAEQLAPAPWLDAVLEGVMAEDFGECPLTGAAGGAIDNANRLTIGRELKTFTIEKRFPNAASVPGAMPITATPGATGSQTADLTFAGGASTGTGAAVFDVTVGNQTMRYSVPIGVGDDETAVAAAAVIIVNDRGGIVTASAVAGVLTLDAGTGKTVDGLTARSGADTYVYQRYKGSTFSVAAISITPNEDVSGTFTVVAGEPELDDLPITGATYVGAGSSAVFTAPEVIELTVGSLAVGTSCWTEMTITLDSQNRGIACIGSRGEREAVLGKLSVVAEGAVYFAGDQMLLEAMASNQVIGNSVITLTNADGDVLRFDLYQVKATNATLNAEATGSDLTIPVTLEPNPVTVCSDAGEDWDSTIIISKEDTAPTLP